MGFLNAAILAATVCGGGNTVLLDFYSDSCPPCRAMQPVVRQLEARGYPIRRVNVQREPGLASQFGVRGIPCFVMLVDGREVDRVVGATTSGRLEQMLALARVRRPAAASPVGWGQAGDPSPGAIPIPAETSNRTFAAAVQPPQSPSGSPPAAAQGPPPSAAPGGRSEEQLEADLLACTVRLRVEDAEGSDCGSGTIIDARDHWALVLTCGHIFRDSKGSGRIAVDLFGPHAAERVPGQLVHYDLDKDLGLIRIPVPGPVCVARVAPPGYQIAKGARVIDVGCNHSEPPTVRSGHVTALDKFLGPENVEVSGLPVQGRSGGGLFSAEGLVIGVCNAAVPTDNEGLYAALASIHAELDQTQLTFVYRGPAAMPPSPDPRRPSATAIATSDLPSMPKRMPPPSEILQFTDAPGQPRRADGAERRPPTAPNSGQPRRADGAERRPPATLTPDERAALEEIQRRKAQGAEVICIVRSRTDPQAPSEVITLDRVSPAFLRQLTTDPAPQASHSMRSAESNGPKPSRGAPAGQASPSAGSVVPAGHATGTAPWPAIPISDWRPRWLESGYQGS